MGTFFQYWLIFGVILAHTPLATVIGAIVRISPRRRRPIYRLSGQCDPHGTLSVCHWQIIDSNDPEPDMETTTTDLEDDLGLESDLGFGLTAELEHPNRYLPQVRVDYSPMLFKGEHNLSKNLRIDGMSYRAGQRVKTRLEAIAWDLTLLYHPVSTGHPRRPGFRLGLGVTARNTQALLNVQGVGIWRVASERYDVPILPMAFVSLEVMPYRLVGFLLEAKGITDGNSQWWDARSEFRTSPIGPMSWIGLGFRWQQLKVVQENEGGLDATVMGGLASIGLRF